MPGADNFPVLKAGKAILLIDEGATGGVGGWGEGRNKRKIEARFGRGKEEGIADSVS